MTLDSDWWQKDSVRGELEQALAHINGVDASGPMDDVTRCRTLFDALNCLWTAHRRATSTLDLSDSAAIANLLTVGMPHSQTQWLCATTQVPQFATFKPPIQDHDVLRRSAAYRPNQAIPPQLERKAADKHGQLARAIERWKNARSTETHTALLKKLAQMLYVVRSNIAHGEKTPFGPDLQRAERDRCVCSVTVPVLRVLFEALLDNPSSRLAAYGSLALGQANHVVLADIPGVWEDGFVRGVLQEMEGLLALKWRPTSEKVPVKLFASAALKGNWERLDRFEGLGYRRILVPIETAHGKAVVANLYEARGV